MNLITRLKSLFTRPAVEATQPEPAPVERRTYPPHLKADEGFDIDALAPLSMVVDEALEC